MSGVQRDNFVGWGWRLHRVHHAVHHQRGGFELGRTIHRTDLQHPLQFEVLHIVRRDLIQQAVALVEECPAVREPVLRFFVRIENSFERHLLSRQHTRGEQQQK